MTEITPRGSQLDRIEGKLDMALDRLARAEERQISQAARLDSHGMTLEKHAERLGLVEVSLAKSGTGIASLNSRWAAVGAVALIILSTIGGYISRIIAP